jgi:hypothetical protein
METAQSHAMAPLPESIRIGDRDYPVWPENQPVKGRGDRVIAMTHFADAADFHPALIAKMTQLYEDPGVQRMYSPSSAGTKIHQVDSWGIPEADLVNARARAFFQRVFGQSQSHVHVSWINISRRGEYSMAHAHPDCMAVVVYALDNGDPNPEDPLEGQLAFIDPRYEACCRSQKDFMTTPFMPKMPPGTMIIFPSSLVHSVNPYRGERPRMTFSWDLNNSPSGTPRVLSAGGS